MTAFVLLPGLDGTGRLFGPLVARLIVALGDASSIHTVAYPSAEVLDLDQLADLIDIPSEPFVVVAESFSGPVALRLAARRPVGLVALVLVASFVRPPINVVSRALIRIGAGLAARLPLPRFAIRAMLTGPDPELADQVAAAVASVEPSVIASRLRLVATVDAVDDLARCPCPILVLEGSRDRLVRPGRFAASETVTVRSLPAPHLVLQVAPELAAAAIAEFSSRRGPA